LTKTITILNTGNSEQELLLYNVSYSIEYGEVSVKKIKADLKDYFKENRINTIKQLIVKNKDWKNIFEKTRTVELLIEFKKYKDINQEFIAKELKKRRRL